MVPTVERGLDGDGGREAFDGVDVGALDLIEELAGVGGEGFDVATLAFGVDGVEGEGRFPGTGKAGDYSQGVARDLHIDVAQVVLAGATNGNLGDGHSRGRLVYVSKNEEYGRIAL
jgi:hypothetical protein